MTSFIIFTHLKLAENIWFLKNPQFQISLKIFCISAHGQSSAQTLSEKAFITQTKRTGQGVKFWQHTAAVMIQPECKLNCWPCKTNNGTKHWYVCWIFWGIKVTKCPLSIFFTCPCQRTSIKAALLFQRKYCVSWYFKAEGWSVCWRQDLY